MNKFSELKFKNRIEDGYNFGIQCVKDFPNGYSASIIKGPYTYGGPEGLYEIAIIHNNRIDYTTHITNDVCGYLTVEEVESVLDNIEKLPPKI